VIMDISKEHLAPTVLSASGKPRAIRHCFIALGTVIHIFHGSLTHKPHNWTFEPINMDKEDEDYRYFERNID
jgi:hypothetical protein